MAKRDPYSALRFADFRYFVGVQLFFTIAFLIQETVVGYYIYKLTHDPIHLGYVGLAEAIPYISMALFGGYVADKFDRKRTIIICYLGVLLCSVALYFITSAELSLSVDTRLALTYAVLFCIGTARGFYGPALSSLKPFLVPAEHYANSATWSSQFWQSGMILGPIFGGILYAYVGIGQTLLIAVGLFLLAIGIFLKIESRPVLKVEKKGGIFESLKEGIDFVFKNKIILYAIFLDMVSVLFGGVMAILPVFAEDILKVGSEGFGVLRAAPGVGAVLTMLLAAYYPPTINAWRNMLIAVAGFGVATLAFAFSTNFIFSLLMLFLTGAFDSISVIIRQTILQVFPPENMRGRVNSVNGIFVSCSNELGAFESGVAAKLMGTVPSVIFGGVITLSFVTFIFFKTRDLFSVKLQR
jgi:MFS family permease